MNSHYFHFNIMQIVLVEMFSFGWKNRQSNQKWVEGLQKYQEWLKKNRGKKVTGYTLGLEGICSRTMGIKGMLQGAD